VAMNPKKRIGIRRPYTAKAGSSKWLFFSKEKTIGNLQKAKLFETSKTSKRFLHEKTMENIRYEEKPMKICPDPSYKEEP